MIALLLALALVFLVPLKSVQRSSTSLAVDKPVPCRVMAWPGLAEGTATFAGVPLSAAPAMPVTFSAKAVLVPPAVLTVIGPNTPAESGTSSTTLPLTM